MYPGPERPGPRRLRREPRARARGARARDRTRRRRPSRRSRSTAPRPRPRRPPCGASASVPTSSTRTSSSRPASLRRSRRALHSSSRRTGRTSRTSERLPGVRAATVLRRASGRRGRRRLALAEASGSRTRFRTRSARSRWSTAASTSSAFRRERADEARAEVGWRSDGTALPLPRQPQRAQERAAARPRLRALTGRAGSSFVGDGPLRAALEDRARIRLVGRVGHESRPRVDRRVLTSLCQPSLDGAVRARHARGDGVGTLGRRDDRRRPARVRDRRRPASSSTPLDDDAARPSARSGRRAPPSQPRGPGRRRRARRQAAGGAGGGDPPASRSQVGEPDLDERPDRVLETVPPARRPAPPRSVSRTFSGATPCFSRLSPVTSSFWMRSRASSAIGGA